MLGSVGMVVVDNVSLGGHGDGVAMTGGVAT
jgi:hypothetical protein